ncbi:MAG: hypothetical protein JST83_07500 [Bacteroidetes bacterium]|nr:hypothetical protein [Bacteroidota bacterium]
MKKSVMSLFALGTMAALILSSCGAKYTPLTEDQKQAKADSIYAAKVVDEVKAKSDDCDKNLEAAVDAKVEEMKANATAETK